MPLDTATTAATSTPPPAVTSSTAPSSRWFGSTRRPSSLIRPTCAPSSPIWTSRRCRVIEPLVVVLLPDGGHRLLAGHRRVATAVIAGQRVVPYLVRADMVDAEGDQLAASLAENTVRDTLAPVELAHAYAQLAAFNGWSIQRIARVAGQPETSVRHATEVTKLLPHSSRRRLAGTVVGRCHPPKNFSG